MLKLLAEHPGEPVSRERFLEVVWSYNAYPTTRTVDNQILSLRSKLRSRARASPGISSPCMASATAWK